MHWSADKDLSPVNTAFKLLEAKSPAINLTPVPELPKNNSFVGSL